MTRMADGIPVNLRALAGTRSASAWAVNRGNAGGHRCL